MTAKEIQKRNAKAENLRVLQSEDGQFFVESEKGKVLYNVVLGDDANTCTCGDFSTGMLYWETMPILVPVAISQLAFAGTKIISANMSLLLSMQSRER